MVEGYDLPGPFFGVNFLRPFLGPKKGLKKMAPEKGQVDNILPPSKRGFYDLLGVFSPNAKVDHILKPCKKPSFCEMGGVGRSYP